MGNVTQIIQTYLDLTKPPLIHKSEKSKFNCCKTPLDLHGGRHSVKINAPLKTHRRKTTHKLVKLATSDATLWEPMQSIQIFINAVWIHFMLRHFYFLLILKYCPHLTKNLCISFFHNHIWDLSCFAPS